MTRIVGSFSCGVASAIACHLADPDVIIYCATGAEHPDNQRFFDECQERLFKKEITVLRSDKYKDTWDVWERKHYIAGIKGAPCTGALKREPKNKFLQDGDIQVFGYTADAHDMNRAKKLREIIPDMRTPLIDHGLNKENCLALIKDRFGIEPPTTYAMGLPHANCIPCPKSQSPAYWALIRDLFPDEFERMRKLTHKTGKEGPVKLIKIDGEWATLEDIPVDQPTTNATVPRCDMMCDMIPDD